MSEDAHDCVEIDSKSREVRGRIAPEIVEGDGRHLSPLAQARHGVRYSIRPHRVLLRASEDVDAPLVAQPVDPSDDVLIDVQVSRFALRFNIDGPASWDWKGLAGSPRSHCPTRG